MLERVYQRFTRNIINNGHDDNNYDHKYTLTLYEGHDGLISFSCFGTSADGFSIVVPKKEVIGNKGYPYRHVSDLLLELRNMGKKVEYLQITYEGDGNMVARLKTNRYKKYVITRYKK